MTTEDLKISDHWRLNRLLPRVELLFVKNQIPNTRNLRGKQRDRLGLLLARGMKDMMTVPWQHVRTETESEDRVQFLTTQALFRPWKEGITHFNYNNPVTILFFFLNLRAVTQFKQVETRPRNDWGSCGTLQKHLFETGSLVTGDSLLRGSQAGTVHISEKHMIV